MKRKRLWYWIPALLLLLGLWLLQVSRPGRRPEGCPDGCASPPPKMERHPLRVLSLNVLHGFPRFEHLPERLDHIAREIRRLEVDVALLQEVPWTTTLGSGARYLADRAGMNDLYYRANGNRYAIRFEEGEAILSRYPLRDPLFAELEPRAGVFEHRVVLSAIAETPQGPIRFFVTHLTNGAPEVNRGQAQSLMEAVATASPLPAVVGGDFNATEETPQIQALTDRWVDAYRIAHPDEAGPTCCIDDLSAGPNEPLEKRIDYLFLVPGRTATLNLLESHRVLTRPFRLEEGWWWPSDHVGVLAVVEIASPTPLVSLTPFDPAGGEAVAPPEYPKGH